MLSYEDADDDAAAWAWAMEKPAAPIDFGEIVRVPRFWQADSGRSFILCTRDKVLPKNRARLFCRRLGVDPLEIDAAHCPYLSRPAELAALLVEATTTQPIGPLMPTNPAPTPEGRPP